MARSQARTVPANRRGSFPSDKYKLNRQLLCQRRYHICNLDQSDIVGSAPNSSLHSCISVQLEEDARYQYSMRKICSCHGPEDDMAITPRQI